MTDVDVTIAVCGLLSGCDEDDTRIILVDNGGVVLGKVAASSERRYLESGDIGSV